MSGRNLNVSISNKNAQRREFDLYAHFPFKAFANFQPSQDYDVNSPNGKYRKQPKGMGEAVFLRNKTLLNY